MIQFALVIVMLAPQFWAARARHGPALHLTLLLSSLILVTTYFLVTPAPAAAPNAPDPDFTYIGLATLGLVALVPLFWALEQMFPSYDFTVATILGQGLALALTASILMLSTSTPVFEWMALTLVVGLFGTGLHVVHYGTLE